MSLGALDPAVSFRRDDGFGAGLGDLVDKMVGVIALVGDRHVRCETIDKVVCEGDVIALPRGADQTDWIAETIASGMDFGASDRLETDPGPGHPPPFCLAGASGVLMRPHNG